MALKLLGPTDTVRVRNEGELLTRAERRATSREKSVRMDKRTLVAYVSEGRWCADCPACRAGIAIHPEWTSAACFGRGCHRVYTSIAVPPDWKDIETALEKRDLLNQNMRPGETAKDLEDENKAHGVDEPRDIEPIEPEVRP